MPGNRQVMKMYRYITFSHSDVFPFHPSRIHDLLKAVNGGEIRVQLSCLGRDSGAALSPWKGRNKPAVIEVMRDSMMDTYTMPDPKLPPGLKVAWGGIMPEEWSGSCSIFRNKHQWWWCSLYALNRNSSKAKNNGCTLKIENTWDIQTCATTPQKTIKPGEWYETFHHFGNSAGTNLKPLSPPGFHHLLDGPCIPNVVSVRLNHRQSLPV